MIMILKIIMTMKIAMINLAIELKKAKVIMEMV